MLNVDSIKSHYHQAIGHSLLRLALLLALLVLSGCKTFDTAGGGATPEVGPSTEAPLYTEPGKKQYRQDSDVFLDVVIPVFDPGLPLDNLSGIDYREIEKKGIWPQLRRAEANRFAVETRRAVDDLGTFGSVSVVPTASASGDVYVLGKIHQSDSETVKLGVKVVDSQGKLWGSEEFTHKVSTGFFRDRLNEGKDSYEPIFGRIADYVYTLLQNKTEEEKQTIKTITDLRYAQQYSPETFGRHLKRYKTWNGNYEYKLVSLPNETDAMLSRIKPLRVQDQLFIDRLQVHYDAFNAKTDTSYRAWQKEALTEVAALKKSRGKRNTQIGVGLTLAALALVLDRNSSSTAGALGTGLGILASGYFIGSALEKNAELKVHKQTIDEVGESLDIEMSPQLINHNDQTVELTGTANEQYTQWKNHLKAIYELEKTPDNPL